MFPNLPGFLLPPCVLVGGLVLTALLGATGIGAQAVDPATSAVVESMTTATDSSSIQELAMAAQALPPKAPESLVKPGTDIVSLLIQGGWFMVPIALVSLLALAFAIERFIGLRRGKILPRGLVRKLTQLTRESDVIDPRAAYPCCLDYPSAASNVVKAILARAGRPMPELEALAQEVSQREADKAYAGVRWLHFAAGVAPLLGLLGTIWGLIQAFHDMTLLGPSQNRAEYLGRGIYIALVTTLAGLVVAIPATLAAHWFEARITRLFGYLQELASSLIAKLERLEGKARFEVIGRELVGRNLESSRKSLATADVSKGAPPPGPNATTNASAAVNPATSTRKTIYQP